MGPQPGTRTHHGDRAARARRRVVSLTEKFDLEIKERRFMFAVLAAAAEYELELRAERQARGDRRRQVARGEGRMLPGPSVL
ncbi:recombinase family protein [Actinomadura coerulea]|uniref:recombinase family protein n=1 Tax=Actinomadura coerulea TaxID=46159 RepID=UPI00343A5CB1